MWVFFSALILLEFWIPFPPDIFQRNNSQANTFHSFALLLSFLTSHSHRFVSIFLFTISRERNTIYIFCKCFFFFSLFMSVWLQMANGSGSNNTIKTMIKANKCFKCQRQQQQQRNPIPLKYVGLGSFAIRKLFDFIEIHTNKQKRKKKKKRSIKSQTLFQVDCIPRSGLFDLTLHVYTLYKIQSSISRECVCMCIHERLTNFLNISNFYTFIVVNEAVCVWVCLCACDVLFVFWPLKLIFNVRILYHYYYFIMFVFFHLFFYPSEKILQFYWILSLSHMASIKSSHCIKRSVQRLFRVCLVFNCCVHIHTHTHADMR